MDKGIEVTYATSSAVLQKASGVEQFYSTFGAHVAMILMAIGGGVVALIFLVGLFAVIKGVLPHRKPKQLPMRAIK